MTLKAIDLPPKENGTTGQIDAFPVILTVMLGWPAKELSPNARVHHFAKAKAVSKARALGWAIALEAGARTMMVPEGSLHLWITFFPPSKRRYDADNLLAQCKGAFDGIAQALGVDDARFFLHPMVSDQVVKGGQVAVCITGGGDLSDLPYPRAAK